MKIKKLRKTYQGLLAKSRCDLLCLGEKYRLARSSLYTQKKDFCKMVFEGEGNFAEVIIPP